jgi:hypothetical protein
MWGAKPWLPGLTRSLGVLRCGPRLDHMSPSHPTYALCSFMWTLYYSATPFCLTYQGKAWVGGGGQREIQTIVSHPSAAPNSAALKACHSWTGSNPLMLSLFFYLYMGSTPNLGSSYMANITFWTLVSGCKTQVQCVLRCGHRSPSEILLRYNQRNG